MKILGGLEILCEVYRPRPIYIYLIHGQMEREFLQLPPMGLLLVKEWIELAEDDEQMNERLELYRYRVPEELYQVRRDPGCLEKI